MDDLEKINNALLSRGPMHPDDFAQLLDSELGSAEDLDDKLRAKGIHLPFMILKFFHSTIRQSCSSANKKVWMNPSRHEHPSRFNEFLCQQLGLEYKSFCDTCVQYHSHTIYLRYQDIVNELDVVKEKFVRGHADDPAKYQQHIHLCHELHQTQLKYRDFLFGRDFVIQQLDERDKDKRNYKRCPSCRTPWWDDSGCQQRRCGHHGAPQWDREHVEVPPRGASGKRSGCGRKFEWNFGEPLSDTEFATFWDVIFKPPIRQLHPGQEEKAFQNAVTRLRSRSPRRSKCTGDVQVKVEQADDFEVIYSVPTSTGWDVEIAYMPTAQGGIRTVFTETECSPRSPKCFLPGTHFLRLDGGLVEVGHLLVGEKLQGPLGEVSVESVVRRNENYRTVINMRFARGDFTVTDDHRMCLENCAYRLARDLQQNDMVSTTEGAQHIVSIQANTERISVFEVGFYADRAVFMCMPPTTKGVMVAAFGVASCPDENKYMHFKFKGPICRAVVSRFSAEEWLSQYLADLVEYDMQFLSTAPYSVWVLREQGNDFYEAVKALLQSHAPSSSRLRQKAAFSSGLRAKDGNDTPPPLTP